MKKTSLFPLPTEILSNIFSNLDGKSLIACKRTCHHWHDVITGYDDIIWPNTCHLDFGKANANIHRFWSLQFPKPTTLISKQPTWQDMYRTTYNWYHGYAKGICPEPSLSPTTSGLIPCAVIGAPQEEGMVTTLTLSQDKQVIRSNPNYHSIMVQSPQTNQLSFLQIESTPGVVCHYTHPSSNYLVTGSLNGTVSVWDLVTKSLVRTWQGHRGRVLCISMNEQGKSLFYLFIFMHDF
jgi:WD40 repeat protein